LLPLGQKASVPSEDIQHLTELQFSSVRVNSVANAMMGDSLVVWKKGQV